MIASLLRRALPLAAAFTVLITPALGQDLPLPDVPDTSAVTEGDFSDPVKVVLILTLLSILPALLMTMTAFTRIIIVLGFVRRALSVTEIPPNQVLIGLALFLSLAVMSPVMGKIDEVALQPYLAEEMTMMEAAQVASEHLGTFLARQTREDDAKLILDISGLETPETPEDIPLQVIVPAFVLSELRTAFMMGFLIYLPFLVIDIVVAAVLLSMGMFMLPPVIISTPFKILLFILVDGWALVVRELFQSFQAVPL